MDQSIRNGNLYLRSSSRKESAAAVIETLREDAIDLEAFDKRSKEPARAVDQILKDLDLQQSDRGISLLAH